MIKIYSYKMAYKKFIKKNGKIYGPYVYHSKRVNGKVISEYHGMSDKKPLLNKKTIIYLSSILVSLALIALLIFSPNLTGNVVGNIISPNNNETSTNQFNLQLKEGEFIPADSIISLQFENQTYNFTIAELYSDKLQTNSFYLEGENLTGEGEGIGIPGNKEKIVPVYFNLELTQTQENNSPDTKTNSTTEENDTQIQENQTIQETPKKNETQQTEPINESTNESTEPTTEEENNTTEETQQNTSPITGNAIIENTISGQVEKGKDFKYNLSENEDVKLISGSVKTQNDQLDDEEITIKKEGNSITISTNYSEKQEGFGSEYLGKEKDIKLNLDQLNFSVNDSVKIKISYKNTTIYETQQTIEENNSPETPITSNNETNITIEENTTQIIQNATNITELNIEYENLTEAEKDILRNEFKIIALNSTAYEYKDKIMVNSKIGDYEVSNVYPNTIQEEKLKEIIKKDQISWLKDIAKELSQENYNTTRRTDLDSIYSQF